MKILVIPDIHHKIQTAQRIIDKHENEVDLILHLGDYHDNFNDTPEHARATAQWMKNRLDAGDVLLLGNHDLPYLYPHAAHACSGFTPAKYDAVFQIWEPTDTARINFWVVEDDVLYSHAGFGQYWYDSLQPFHPTTQDQLYQKVRTRGTHMSLTACDPTREGNSIFPGFLWRDWRWGQIQKDWPKAIKQIVGHTPGYAPRRHDSVLCLDTHLHHYAIVTDGKAKTYDTPKSFFEGNKWTKT